MAKNAEQKLSSRRAPTQKETYRHSQGLEVAARPTSYAGEGAGYKGLGNLQALTKALESGKGVLAGYAEYKRQKAVVDKEAGYLLEQSGGELAEDASTHKVKGWMRSKGEGDAFEFERRVSEYLQESWQQSPDQFKKGVEDLTAEYLDESKDQSYIEGFAPKAQRAEQKAFMKYMEANHEQTMSDGLDNLAKAARSDLENMEDRSPQQVRKLLSEVQAKGKSFGLTRDTVTSRFITMLGRQAELEADPSLLDFVNEPDEEGGLRLTSTKHAEEVRTWQERAEAEAQRKENQQAARVKDLRNRAKKQIERDYMAQILQTEPDQRGLLIQMKQQLLSTWSNPNNNELGVALDARDMKTYVDMIDDQLDLDGFAERSNPEVMASLDSWIQAASTQEDFNAGADTINLMKHQLTASDFQSLRRKLGQEYSQLENQEYNEAKNYVSGFIADSAKTVAVKEDNIFGGTPDIALTQLNSDRKGTYKLKMRTAIAAHKRENEGKMPGEAELYNIKKRVTEDVKEMFPHESDDKKTPTGGSTFGGGTQQSTTQPPPQKQEQQNKQESKDTGDPVVNGLRGLRRQ